MRRVLSVLVLTIVAVVISGMTAHRQPEITTNIVMTTDATGAPVGQITHRFHAHDAIKLIELIDGSRPEELDRPAQLARIADSIVSELDLSRDGHQSITLGAEIDGDNVFVYQETTAHPTVIGGRGLSSLSENWQHFVNTVGPDGAMVASYHFSEKRGATVAIQRQRGLIPA